MTKRIERDKLKTMGDLSDLKILLLNKLIPVLDYFNLLTPEHGDGFTTTDIMYWSKALRFNKEFSIDKIKYDILNNIDKYTLALKYLEPLEVIEDIINGHYDEKTGIVNSKIYVGKDLENIFPIARFERDFLHDKALNYKLKSPFTKDRVLDGRWYGEGREIIDVMQIFNDKDTRLDENGVKYISERKASIMLTNLKTNRLKLMSDGKMFNVKIRTKTIGNHITFNLEDCEKALSNKRLYIRKEEITAYYNLPTKEQSKARDLFNIKFNKPFKDLWLLKEEAVYMSNICNGKLKERDLYRLGNISCFRRLTKYWRDLALEELTANGVKHSNHTTNKNETPSIELKDLDVTTKISKKYLNKQRKEIDITDPVVGMNELSTYMDISAAKLKDFVKTGFIMGIKVKTRDSKYGGIGISRYLLKSIIKERDKYTYIYRNGMWDNVSDVRKTIIRKEYAEYFYGENLFLTSIYDALLDTIEKHREEQAIRKNTHTYKI